MRSGREKMAVAQMPGWARYIWGRCERWGKKREMASRVDGRLEVRARMSVSRFELSYACGEERPWRSVELKVRAMASKLEIQIMRLDGERSGCSWWVRR